MNTRKPSLTEVQSLLDMLKTPGWQLYEEFISSYINEYIASSIPRNQLVGMKMAVTAIKDFTSESIKKLKIS